MRTPAMILLGALLLPGCLGDGESRVIPWPAAGSEAVYSLGPEGMMVVSVRGLVPVRDAAGDAQEALRIDYEWRRIGRPLVASQFVDGSGRVVVVGTSVQFCADSECEDGAINKDGRWDYMYDSEGSPGLLGLAPLFGSAVGPGCQDQHLRALWVGPTFRRPLPLEAAAVQVCDGPFPARVQSAGRNLELESVRWTPGDPPRGVLRYDTHLGAAFERWNPPFPPSWSPVEAFSLREAFDWARANDEPFADYLARHPEAILHGTGSHWAGSTKVVLEEQRWRRTLTLQDPPGHERHRLILVKRVVQTGAGSVSEIVAEQSSRENVPPSLDRSALPATVMNRALVEQVLEDRLGMSVDSASIRGFSPSPEGDEVPNGDHYEYALYFPTSAATPLSFPYEARVNASSGRLEFLSVPQDRWFPVPPAG